MVGAGENRSQTFDMLRFWLNIYFNKDAWIYKRLTSMHWLSGRLELQAFVLISNLTDSQVKLPAICCVKLDLLKLKT